MLGLIAFEFILFSVITQRPVNGLSFVLAVLMLGSLLLMVYLGYRSLSAFFLEYWVDRDGVTLLWGNSRQRVPMGDIERVLLGTAAQSLMSPRPWHWPCATRRRMVTDGLGIVNAYATRPLAEQVILVTADESFGLSPADPQGFVAALQARKALGVAHTDALAIQRPPLWTWPLWRDRVALWVIGLGLLGVLIMFGGLAFRYPVLSSDLPLHFDVLGLPDRIEDKSRLFTLPVIGLLTWLFNAATGIWLYRHVQRGAAYLLWGGALAVQGILALGLFILMQW
jgi:hypothetical protein